MKNTQVIINEPLSETACKSNQKQLTGKKKLTCTKPPQPGSTQGNCPFDGAMVSVGAITDAVHLCNQLKQLLAECSGKIKHILRR